MISIECQGDRLADTMRVYFIGSHATGKTTLCRHVSRQYQLPMITEVARTVLAEMETTLGAIRTDMQAVGEYQKKVFERQVAVEHQAKDGFVSDRAFDNLAYAAEHTTSVADIFGTGLFTDYMKWVSQGIVFFVRPSKDCLKEDGVRADVAWDAVLRIDGMIKLMLEQHRVNYLPLASTSMQERVRAIDFVLRTHASALTTKPGVAAPPAAVAAAPTTPVLGGGAIVPTN